MKNKFLFVTIILSIAFFTAKCGSKSNISNQQKKVNVELSCIAFYNLENLFDTIDSPNTNDTEYTPNGANKWNTYKYNSKLQKMSYAISQIGLDYSTLGAAIIGVSEIENRTVLEDLVKQPAIADRSYEIVHYDSPDRRGIDVALLYNPRLFVVSNTKAHPFHMEGNPDFKTRDQLLVSGYLQNEKIHLIVNHWPSRYGGEVASRPSRVAAAKVTKSIVDSLYKVEPNAKIIIMGDLNDDPHNVSVAEILGAKKDTKNLEGQDLYNTMWAIHEKGIGSLAYQGQWNLFDQIIISSPLVNADRTELKFWKGAVFNAPFLTHQEGAEKGMPLRTHSKGVWLNGYSDHYPTYIYLVKEAQ